MTDYHSNNTLRVRLKYVTFDGTHNVLFRFSDETSILSAGSQVAAFVNAADGAFFNDTTFEQYAIAEKDSDEFLLTYDLGLVGTKSGSRSEGQPEGSYWNFTGRSILGSQVSWYFYGVPWLAIRRNFFIYYANEDATTIFEAFNDSFTTLVAIDGAAINRRGRVNVGINDYLMHQSRQ